MTIAGVQENSFIFDVHYEDFSKRVLDASHTQPVLVDFWAEWCSPCLVIAPVLTQVVNEYKGRVLLAKLEVDEGENMKLAGQHRVRGFPTIVLFREGNEVARFASAHPPQFIRDFIDEHAGL